MTKLCEKCGERNRSWPSKNCFACDKEIQEEELAQKLLNDEQTETHYEDDITCPWCGARWSGFDEDETASYIDEQEYETECGNCEKELYYDATVNITFSTRRKKND